MDKALPGSIHATFEFCSTHWKELIAASVLPVSILAIVTILSWFYMGDLISVTTLSRFNYAVDFKQNMIHMMGGVWPKIVLLGIVSSFATAWHFTRIAQYRRDMAVKVLGFQTGEFGNAAMLVMYYICLFLLIALCYLALAIVVGIIFLITRAIFGEGVVMGIALVVAGVAAIVAILIVSTRLFLAFPQIALGYRPNLFTDMLQLAKGEVWSGFWRLLVLIGGFAIMSLVLQLIFVMPIANQFSNQIFNLSGTVDPSVTAKISVGLIPYFVVAQIFGAIAVAIVTILSVEMNSRLLLKQSHQRL